MIIADESNPDNSALLVPDSDAATMVIAEEVELACRLLVIRFAQYLDHRRFDEVAALFADDGVWHRRGVDLRGPGEILAFLRQRPSSVVERHVMTTILVEQLSDSTCVATSYATILRTEHAGADVPTIAGPSRFGEFHDRFERTSLGWRFTHRSSTPIFLFDAAR